VEFLSVGSLTPLGYGLDLGLDLRAE